VDRAAGLHLIWGRDPGTAALLAGPDGGDADAAFVGEVEPDGTLRLLALQPTAVAPGKDLEL
jgi:hypothetical protein